MYRSPSPKSPYRLSRVDYGNINNLPSFKYIYEGNDFPEDYETTNVEYDFLLNSKDIEYKKKFIEYKNTQLLQLKSLIKLKKSKIENIKKINNAKLMNLEKEANAEYLSFLSIIIIIVR